MPLRRLLAGFNGTVIGSVLGLAVYVYLAGTPSPAEFLLAIPDVGTFAAAAAGGGTVLSWVKVYPLGPIWAGIVSGIVGGLLAYVLPTALAVSITIPTQVIGGLIASVVLSILIRLLPGL